MVRAPRRVRHSPVTRVDNAGIYRTTVGWGRRGAGAWELDLRLTVLDRLDRAELGSGPG